MRTSDDGERGDAAVEAVILVPGLGLFVAAIIFAGRLAIVHQSVDSAAAEGARSASLSRDAGTAAQRATEVVEATLANQGLRCVNTSVEVDTTGFAAPVGTPASVEVTVTCVLDATDLLLPFDGRRTVVATMSSPIDTWRQR